MLSAVLLSVAVSVPGPASLAAPLVAQQTEPPIRLWVNKTEPRIGDRVKVRVRSEEDGYLVVLHAEPDGRVRVLFPIDPVYDNFIRGRDKFEVRGRGDREAFRIYTSEGLGTVYAAFSRDPFQFDGLTRSNHWDYGLTDIWLVGDDPETELTDLILQMASGAFFDYDVMHYDVGGKRGYVASGGLGYYDPYYYDYYRPYGFSVGLHFGFGHHSQFGFGFGRHFGHHYYDPFYYDPFYNGYYDPYWYGFFPYYGFSHYRYHSGFYYVDAYRGGRVNYYANAFVNRRYTSKGPGTVYTGGTPTRQRVYTSGPTATGRRLGTSTGGAASGRRVASGSSTTPVASGRRVASSGSSTSRGRDRVSVSADNIRPQADRTTTRRRTTTTNDAPRVNESTESDGARRASPRGRVSPRDETSSGRSSGARRVTSTRRTSDNEAIESSGIPTSRRVTPSRESEDESASEDESPTARRVTPRRSTGVSSGGSARRRVISSGSVSRSKESSAGPTRRVSPSRGSSARPTRSASPTRRSSAKPTRSAAPRRSTSTVRKSGGSAPRSSSRIKSSSSSRSSASSTRSRPSSSRSNSRKRKGN